MRNIKEALEKIKQDVPIEEWEKDSICMFADKFISCSLKDPRVRDIVKAVNVHHHTKTCRKYSCDCRFFFPRFPSLETIVSVPIRMWNNISPEEQDSLVEESNRILSQVKTVLEEEKLMEVFNNFGRFLTVLTQ